MIVYFDTSAVVKLLVEEDGADLARRAWAAADVVAFSLLVEPEARSALAAAARQNRIDAGQAQTAKSELSWRLMRGARIEVTASICARAGDLADQHALRGYDAVHLASAMAAGPELMLASWDRDLRSAAETEGMGLIPAALV
ncbi:type II toxin-antitoxin system VapC family toxin [soil metagenome]